MDAASSGRLLTGSDRAVLLRAISSETEWLELDPGVAGRPSEVLQQECDLLDRLGALVAARACARSGGLPAAPSATPLEEVGTPEMQETECFEEASATVDINDDSELASLARATWGDPCDKSRLL